jgi:hypothetical protein
MTSGAITICGSIAEKREPVKPSHEKTRSKRDRGRERPKEPKAVAVSLRARLLEPRVAALFLGIVAVGFCALFFNPLLSTIGDNAQFIVLGKSLLAGHGLSHINAPDQKPDTKYPFLYPLILAGVLWVAPGSVVALKMIGVVACVGAALLYYPLFRKSAEPAAALGAAALAVLSPDILRHSSIVIAEVPYLFVSMAALAFVSWAEGRRPERYWVPVALVLVMAAYYIKATGIALAAAIVLLLLVRRRWRWAFGFLGGAVLLALPWALRARSIGGGGTYVDYLFMKDPYRPYLGTIAPGAMLSRFAGNVVLYFQNVVPESVLPFLGRADMVPGAGLRILWLAVSVLVAAGLVARLLRRRTVVDFYLVAFLGICVLWPRVWAGTRFIVPVIPLLLLCFLSGLGVLADLAGLKSTPRTRDGCLVALSILMAVGFISVDRVEARWDRQYTPDWESYFEAARWVKSNTPPESVVVCRKPYLFFLVSDRRSMGYPFSADTGEVLRSLEETRATHVAIDQFRWTRTSALYLVPTVLAYPDRFDVVYATEQEPQTFVMRFVSETKEEP